MLKRFKGIAIVCLIVVMLLSSACTTKTPAPGPSNDTGVAQDEPEVLEPIEIDIFIAFNGVEYPQPGNPVQDAIEKYTNTKLEIIAYPGATYLELLPTMIASNELPMLLGLAGSQLTNAYILNAMDSGYFWDLTDRIKNYPNLSEISEITYESYKRDGKIYGVPRQRDLTRSAVGYRYDWVKNLGLEDPKTVYDLYDLIVAFTQEDPNGSGKKDTYGTANSPLGTLASSLGAPNTWKYEDGKMIRDVFTEEYMEALDLTRQLYSIGAIHPEYPIHSRSQVEAMWTEGKAGMYFNISNFAIYQMAEPNAEVHVNGVFPSDKGTFTPGGTGHNGILTVSTGAVKEEKTLDRVLDFLNALGDQEMCNLLALGIEGVHYNLVDGVAVPIEEKQDDLNQNIYLPYSAPIAACYPDQRTIPVQRTYLQRRILEVPAENLEYAIGDPTSGLISKTNSEIGADLDTIISDARTNYVMGVISKEDYLEQLEEWKKRGGNQIAEEYVKLYEERQGL